MSFTVDGVEWSVPCRITRTAELKSSEVSGMLLDRSYVNDVLGTWMSYTVELEVPFGMEAQYASLYEILADPVDAHGFKFPYNNGHLTITARVEVISDQYVRKRNGSHWRHTKFTAISLAPTKSYTQAEMLARGFAPLPEEGVANEGDIYEYSNNGWVELDLANADDVGY